MARAIHPTLNRAFYNLVDGFPFIAGLVITEDDAVVQIVLKKVFAQAQVVPVVQWPAAFQTSGSRALRRRLAVWVDVVKKRAPRHITAVSAGKIREFRVRLERS